MTSQVMVACNIRRGGAPLLGETMLDPGVRAIQPLTAAVTLPVAMGDDEALAARALTIARRTALGVLADAAAADDVAQEVAIVALRRRATLRDPARLDAWLHRIAVRAALREARRGARRRVAEGRTGAGETVHRDEAAEDAAALLAALPPRQRAALTLRYVHDLPDPAIAAALGCRTGTVRSLLSRGRAALRAAHPHLAQPGDRG